ncbi:hypothetical protein [Deinococcus gobiensis]|uniref:PKD domain-containing protein n=1 Tax=Deinococcus gobiensis (strain DSM 21396 / JCM 16679 / CGMCC 1.7299 / I-0) TaxID=745776 RepID=H8H201_DEIGI|nr:hypothetical protein [Deinococcus gobiensis]AFD27548.1 hypothetical protein DGo_PB0279 [Deinococcus gobiensis I-0]
MKITAPLLLLPLLLAACGTQSATPAPQSSFLGNSAGPMGPSYIEAFEAGVQRDLTALGLSGSLSAQATAPKSYLNVLKVNDTTARAYMKTTYPAAIGCALDWGDGTALSTITTPSVVATDKADHTYTQSGSYTIKLTCGTDIKTSTFTALVPKAFGLFDKFNFDNNKTYTFNVLQYQDIGTSYIENNLKFESPYLYMTRNITADKIYPGGNFGLDLFAYDNETTKISTTTGDTFNLNSITAGVWAYYYPITLKAFDANGNTVGTELFTNYVNKGPVEKRVVNWKNVARIEITGDGSSLVIDDMDFSINLK